MGDTGQLVAIDKLVKLKLGTIYGWTAPNPLHDIGPSDKERFDQFEAMVRRKEEQVREFLEALGDEELRLLVNENADGPAFERFENFLREEIVALVRRKPIWVALGFGHPDHAADFNYWSKVGLLSVQEATLLSVGLEPDKEHTDFLELVRDAAGNPKKNEQAVFLSKRYRLMRDYFPFGVSGFISVPPSWLMALIKKIDLEVPEGLKGALAYLGTASLNAGNVEKPDTLTTSEKASMLKLIAAMGCEQYSFDPHDARSGAVPSLRQDLDSVGLPLVSVGRVFGSKSGLN
jgi:hypothetical protein